MGGIYISTSVKAYVYSVVLIYFVLLVYNLSTITSFDYKQFILFPLAFIALGVVLNRDIFDVSNTMYTSITIPITLPAIIFLDPIAASVYAMSVECILLIKRKRETIKFIFNVFSTGFVVILISTVLQHIMYVLSFGIDSPIFFLNVLLAGILYSFLVNGLTFGAIVLQMKKIETQIINDIYRTISTSGVTIFLGIINVFIYFFFGIIGIATFTFLIYLIKPIINFRSILNNEMSTFTQFVLHVIKLYDPITHAHSERVKHWTVMIAKEMKLSSKEVHELSQAASWHDVGKIEIPSTLINKAGKLTDDEFDLIKSHPEKGYLLVKDMYFFKDYLPVIRYHHERLDGKGYPLGLKGNEIPLHARIMCVADSFDAMTSKRSYKQGMTMAEAVDELRKCSGTQFDPAIVEVFIRALQKEYGLNYERWDKQVANF